MTAAMLLGMRGLYYFVFLLLVIARMIARPILKRRIMPPCVRVKRIERDDGVIVAFSFGVAAGVFIIVSQWSELSLGSLLDGGCFTIFWTYWLVSILFEKIEICGDGVIQTSGFSGLHPWEGYASFSWERKTTDGVELSLVSKSWLSKSTSTTRLLVPPQHREAVQQVLDANLPDLSAIEVNSYG